MTGQRALVVLCAAAAILTAASCGGGGRPAAAPAPPPATPAPSPQAPDEEKAAPPEPPLERTAVTLYFPSATGDGLAPEPREIFKTKTPSDRAKQILSDLISGPTTDGALAALPSGTRLRQVYVLDDGTAYADFSADLLSASAGGSDDEIRTVYSVVDSLALNVPEIRHVGILVEGRPCETLSGHVDLRYPLAADRSLIEGAPPGPAPGEEPPPAGPPGTAPSPESTTEV